MNWLVILKAVSLIITPFLSAVAIEEVRRTMTGPDQGEFALLSAMLIVFLPHVLTICCCRGL